MILNGNVNTLDCTNNQTVAVGTDESLYVNHHHPDSLAAANSCYVYRCAESRRRTAPLSMAQNLQERCGCTWGCACRTSMVRRHSVSSNLSRSCRRRVNDCLERCSDSYCRLVFIIWRRPFNVGDRIQIGQHAGDVIDVRIFKFTLMEIGNWVDADQSTGRVLHIPNGLVLSEIVSNYSRGFQYIWNELPVLVTFESNWKKAKTILQEIVTKHAQHSSEVAQKHIQEASRRFMIFYSVLTPTVYTSVAESGVLLTIRYLCEPRTRRGTSETIWEDVLHQFAAHKDIDFAYPTRRFYDNLREGELGTRPSTVAADS